MPTRVRLDLNHDERSVIGENYRASMRAADASVRHRFAGAPGSQRGFTQLRRLRRPSDDGLWRGLFVGLSRPTADQLIQARRVLIVSQRGTDEHVSSALCHSNRVPRNVHELLEGPSHAGNLVPMLVSWRTTKAATLRAGAARMSDSFQSWLDEALHALIVDRRRSLPELLTAYDALEAQAVRALSKEPNERLVEVQRELASLRLTAAKQRGGSVLEAMHLFGRCEQLGYSSAEARVMATSIFAQMCLADGHPELARTKLDDVLLSVPRGTYSRIEDLACELHAAKQRD